MKILGVDFQRVIKGAFAGRLQTITVRKITPGNLGANPTAHTEPEVTDYECDGVEERYTQDEVPDDVVRRDSRRITLIAGTLGAGEVVPTTSDRVKSDGTWYRITFVDRDPGKAAYTLDCRKV